MADPSREEEAAPAVDAGAVVREARRRVEERRAAGAYEGPGESGAVFVDFEGEPDEEELLRYHLHVVERLADIDFGDFEIAPAGGALGRGEVLLKKVIWKLLRFYTYRLFSQQREFNCQVVEALKSYRSWTRAEFDRLGTAIDRLREERARGE